MVDVTNSFMMGIFLINQQTSFNIIGRYHPVGVLLLTNGMDLHRVDPWVLCLTDM
jgi:hypothetical protein